MASRFNCLKRFGIKAIVAALLLFMFTPRVLRVSAADGKEDSSKHDHWTENERDRHGDSDRDDDDKNRVILSFSTVGDSRQDPSKFDPTSVLPLDHLSGQDAIWLQNTKAWARIIRSIERQGSNFLFFNGDMIMGYGWAKAPAATDVSTVVSSDLMKFYRQYGFWRGMVADLMETGTYVVPVPGNHETQCKSCGKTAQVENENAWRQNMGDLILDNERFQSLFGELPSNENTSDNSALDGLATDQHQLSYSFDFRGSHFAVINTDPVGNDTHAPTQWLAADLGAAQARGIKHFFVFGHKPAFTHDYRVVTTPAIDPAGLDKFVTARDDFWDVIAQYKATYFCGHEHDFNLSKHASLHKGSAWQVLVGTGGSPFDAPADPAPVNPTDRYYAWATVKIYENGLVKITAYGFDDHYGPTKVIGSVKIWP